MHYLENQQFTVTRNVADTEIKTGRKMGRIENAVRKVRHYGLSYYVRQTFRRSAYPVSSISNYREPVAGLKGLEIGGPSPVFRADNLIPLYDAVGALDNCNFSSETVWEGQICEGPTFKFSEKKPPGMQYTCEPAELTKARRHSYDFILSSHMLEHSANPLKILGTIGDLLVPHGTLILLLPDKVWTFDHRRPVTTLRHLIDDYEAHIGEDDMNSSS